MTTQHNNYETAAKKIIEHVGKTVVIAVPLGIGKPIGLLNALYRLAEKDSSINLTIITALTLARPLLHNELEKRFVEPILDRLLGDYEDPLYEKPRKLQQLPKNINVLEFFLTPGEYLHNEYVQQNYVASKYTSVVHDIFYYSVNIIAQQVARSRTNLNQYSLSCNSDLFSDVAKKLRELETNGKKIAVIAEVNLNLPFMLGEAVIKSDTFTDIIDTKNYRALFAIPHDEISHQEHLIGMYTSALIKDDGCLQIGIGRLSNAVADAIIMRHKNNAIYQNLLTQLHVQEKFGDIISVVGDISPFEKGLYASTEMLSDEFMELYQAGILKKRVYDNAKLQQLLNSQKITEKITPEFLDLLVENKIINEKLTEKDFYLLQKFGIFKEDITFRSGILVLSATETISADLSSTSAKQEIINKCLGSHLKTGKIIHAGFFFGTLKFYHWLNNLSDEELQQIDMTTISRTNTLLWSYELSQLQRQRARFVNSAMMITLGGAAVSDGLKNYQQVSGVGGQFDFVDMTQNLEEAESIINCRSTVRLGNSIKSSIVWKYSNVTIPRYLRGIVVTEYGIAYCRGKTDVEIIKSLLNITDSRFQEELMNEAKKFGKLPRNYTIPKLFQQNYPATYEPVLRELKLKGYCQTYPFGSELTDEEKVLAQALLFLKKATKLKLLSTLCMSLFFFKDDKKLNKYLARMQLEHPKNIKEYMYKKILIYLIAKQV